MDRNISIFGGVKIKKKKLKSEKVEICRFNYYRFTRSIGTLE